MAKSAIEKRKEVEKIVLDTFDGFSGGSVEDPLTTDPNDFDLDPVPFYEELSEMFGVPFDDTNDYFGGYGGTIEHTIGFIAERWDGKLRK